MARRVGLLRPGFLLLLPLLFASLEADAEAGQAKTSAVFRRNNHDTAEASPSPYFQNNYSRYRRQFPGARDERRSIINSGRSSFQPGGGGSGPLSVGNALPIDAKLFAALRGNQDLSNLGISLDEVMGLEPTTTRPPLRVASDEDRGKICSGGPASGSLGSSPDTTGRKGGRPPPSSAQRAPETRAISFFGGCGEEPEAPVNGLLQCSSYAGCRARCERGYRFPTGDFRLFVACKEGRWEVRGGPWTSIPPCEPECVPACQNEGICLQPNECSCPDNWDGPVCDQPKAPVLQQECSNEPPTPMNSRIFCSKEECIAKCHEKFEFSARVVRLYFDCVGGNWVIRNERYTSIPDCIATCDPGCINGGRCISPDVCECTPDYRGDHCQYQSPASLRLTSDVTKSGRGGVVTRGDGARMRLPLGGWT